MRMRRLHNEINKATGRTTKVDSTKINWKSILYVGIAITVLFVIAELGFQFSVRNWEKGRAIIQDRDFMITADTMMYNYRKEALLLTYSYDGVEYQKEVTHTYRRASNYRRGDGIKIYINPEHPERIKFAKTSIQYIVGIIIGIVIIILAFEHKKYCEKQRSLQRLYSDYGINNMNNNDIFGSNDDFFNSDDFFK